MHYIQKKTWITNKSSKDVFLKGLYLCSQKRKTRTSKDSSCLSICLYLFPKLLELHCWIFVFCQLLTFFLPVSYTFLSCFFIKDNRFKNKMHKTLFTAFFPYRLKQKHRNSKWHLFIPAHWASEIKKSLIIKDDCSSFHSLVCDAPSFVYIL